MNLARSIFVGLCRPSVEKFCELKGRYPHLLGCLLISITLSGMCARAQEPYRQESFEPVATITSFANLHRSLPPKVELGLTIAAGKGQSQDGGRLVRPVAAIGDSQGRVLVADTSPPMIRVFDFPHRKYSEIELATVAKSIAAMATDNRGFLYLSDTDKGRVVILNERGKFIGYLQDKNPSEAYFMAPAGIAVDDDHGTVFVCDRERHKVVKMDRSGRVLAEFGVRGGGSGPGEFRSPTEIAVWKDELFVLDSRNRRIQRLDLDGNFLSQFIVAPSSGLAANAKSLYLGQPGLGRIAILGHDGSLLLSLKSKSEQQFDPAALSFTPKHCLYVVNRASQAVDLIPLESGNRCR